jgi:hypothetical protein
MEAIMIKRENWEKLTTEERVEELYDEVRLNEDATCDIAVEVARETAQDEAKKKLQQLTLCGLAVVVFFTSLFVFVILRLRRIARGKSEVLL